MPYMAVFGLHSQFFQLKNCLLTCIFCLFWGYSLQSVALTVVTHPSVEKSTLSVSELRAIFSMRLTHWSDSSPIRVFVLPNEHPRHKEFSMDVLKMFPHQLQSAWDRLVYSGTGNAPTVVDSEEEMRRVVSITPGAIGYIGDAKEDPDQGMSKRVDGNIKESAKETAEHERLNVIQLP